MTAKDFWSPAFLFRSFALTLGICVTCYALLVLLSYPANIHILHRPLLDGPATHPLTAVSLFLLGYGSVSIARDWNPLLSNAAIHSTLLISTAVIIDHLFDIRLHDAITPFQSIVSEERTSGIENKQGLNTTIMLFLCAAALWLAKHQRQKLSQSVAFVAIFLSVVSMFGHIYGINTLFGHMSIVTTIMGYAMAISILAHTSNTFILQELLVRSKHGQVMRTLLLSLLLITVLLGYLFAKTIDTGSDRDQFGLYILLNCWIMFGLIAVSTVYHNNADRLRDRLEYELEHAANLDFLTQINNRRGFWNDFSREFERSKRSHRPIWLLIFDIDNFKTVNDQAGHPVGDIVLQRVADTIHSEIRKTDFIGRIGGEEFAIILCEAGEGVSTPFNIAESIRQAVAATEIPEWTVDHGPITVSIGVATSEPHSTVDEVYKDADASLYYAKNNGKNRTAYQQQLVSV